MDMSVRPESTAVQVIPLSFERKTPPDVPAKRFVPLAPSGAVARDQMNESVKPESAGLQDVTVAEERNNPPPSVPAKSS